MSHTRSSSDACVTQWSLWLLILAGRFTICWNVRALFRHNCFASLIITLTSWRKCNLLGHRKWRCSLHWNCVQLKRLNLRNSILIRSKHNYAPNLISSRCDRHLLRVVRVKTWTSWGFILWCIVISLRISHRTFINIFSCIFSTTCG
jgi:hypothetical protein